MQPKSQRDLEILAAIHEGVPLSQRILAQRLGVAVGLTNIYLKRLVKKGYVKVFHFQRRPDARKRLRYVLTPRGLAEKSRLTYEYMLHTLALYRRARLTLHDALARLAHDGMKRVALYGIGDAAELAYLSVRELRLEPVGIFTRDGGGEFLGFPVQPLAVLSLDEVDGIVVATLDRPEPYIDELVAAGVPAPMIVTLRRVNGSLRL
jgi:DNA-binding MarR family transcriptional regulator